jgi:hypothetical protein
MLTHRERVRALFAGERPDRPVVDLGGRVASCSTPAYLALKAHLGYGEGLTDETVTLLKTIGRFDERVLEHFDVPFRCSPAPRPKTSSLPTRLRGITSSRETPDRQGRS